MGACPESSSSPLLTVLNISCCWLSHSSFCSLPPSLSPSLSLSLPPSLTLPLSPEKDYSTLASIVWSVEHLMDCLGDY